MKILLFVSSCLLLVSCSSHQNHLSESTIDSIQNNIIVSDSLFKDGNNYSSIISLTNESHLAIYKPSEQSVSLFELPLYKLLASYQIRSKIKCVGIYTYNDTIYTYNDNFLFLYNKNGNIIKTLQLPAINKEHVNINADLISSPLILTKGREFVLNIFPFLNIRDENERNPYFKSERLGIFKLQTDSIALVDEFAAFPNEIGMQEMYYGWNMPIYTRKNDSIYSYIFKGGYSIYEYNVFTRKTKTYKIGNIPQCRLAPYSYDSMGNFSYSRKHDMENDCYVKILYDPKQSKYLIFKALAIDYINENNELSQWNDKPVDLYIVDKDYNVIKQLRIKNMHIYFINNSFISNGNLYLVQRVQDNIQPIIIDKYEI